MLMDQETILTLYREAVDKGDPGKIIKSLAKTNNVAPGEIRQILADAGEFVPRQKKPKLKTAAGEAQDEKATEATEVTEPAAGISASPLLREIVSRGIKSLGDELREQRDKVESLKLDLDQLKKWYEDEARELDRLELMYTAAQAMYQSIPQEGGSDEDTSGSEIGQLAEQRSGD